MSTGFIELNDAGIVQACDGVLQHTSPGYAVLDGNRLLLGEQARQNARLLPSWTNNRYWNQLNNDPIANGTKAIRHHADLAFAHLELIWKQMPNSIDQVVLAVPGFYTRDQLGLLLGMAKEAGMPVAGLVDSALIAISQQPSMSNALFLDISLHRISITQLKSDDTLRKVETHPVGEIGLFTLWDRWVNIVAKQFIQTSRYDPMHQASSEQKLFDLVPGWIESLDGKRAKNFELESQGVKHTTVVPTEQLSTACSTIYPAIVQSIRNLTSTSDAANVFVSHRFLGFPGLDDALKLIPNVDVRYLDATAAAAAAEAHWKKLASTNADVTHTTSLPAMKAPATNQKLQHSATHLLLNHRAYAINNILRVKSFDNSTLYESAENTQFTLFLRGKDMLLECHNTSVLLNGKSCTEQTIISPGDQIKLDNTHATLIAVN